MFQFLCEHLLNISVSQEIMDIAARRLKVELKPQIIITLTDHIVLQLRD